MSHIVAGIDVHKKVLMAAVADGDEQELWFQRRKFGAGAGDLQVLRAWLADLGVQEVVMESTAQYWKPVWRALEGSAALHLAQAQSNRAPRGRKSDYRDAQRLVRRYLADELILSFVPDAEQQLWRTLARTKVRWTRDRSRLQNRLEALLEEMRIKLSSVVSDLFGVSAVRILRAIAKGEKDVEKLAELAEPTLRATKRHLCDALQGAASLNPRYRPVLQQFLAQLALADEHIAALEQELAKALHPHADAIERLAKIPGLGVDSAQQIIAEIGPRAEHFPSPQQLCSWIGSCPGEDESAEESRSKRSPKGSKPMRRILNQAANAAVKAEGTVFQAHYRRIVGRDRTQHAKAVWAVANRLGRLIWIILRRDVQYEERGPKPNPKAIRKRAQRLLRELKTLGYTVNISANPATVPA